MSGTTHLRTSLLAAIAAGTALGIGCQENAPPPAAPVEVPPQPRPLEAPAPAPTTEPAPTPIDGGALDGASASVEADAPGPNGAIDVEATSKPTRPKTCGASTKKERYCFDAFKGPPSQLPNPARSFDARGCLPDDEVRDTCNGVHDVLAGPDVVAKSARQGSQCCYTVCRGPLPPCGRPLLAEDATPRVAAAVERVDWTDADVQVLAVRPPMAERLREAWLADALAEHASVAAFARFSLELLAVGAPASLVAAAQRAGLDEIAHARACFAVAAAYGASSRGPGPLSLGGVALRSRLADVAAAAVEEACAGESFSAMAAAEARGACFDPTVAAVLERIAAEEADHAALGWRFVAWAIATGGAEVRAAVEAAFARVLSGDDDVPIETMTDDDAVAWRAAGRLTEADRARLWRRTRAEVIDPCVRQLLGATERGAPLCLSHHALPVDVERA